jgi:hypothetical protein
MPLLRAMSGDIVVSVPITVTLPADYEALYDREHSTNGTFWATREDLRAAVRGGEFDTAKLKQGLFWCRHAENVGYDARTGKFIPEVRAEELAKQTGLTNLKITQKTINGRPVVTITGNRGGAFRVPALRLDRHRHELHPGDLPPPGEEPLAPG